MKTEYEIIEKLYRPFGEDDYEEDVRTLAIFQSLSEAMIKMSAWKQTTPLLDIRLEKKTTRADGRVIYERVR